MAKARLFLAGVLTLFAVGIATTGAAYAEGTLGEACSESSTMWLLCIESGGVLTLLIGTAAFSGKKEPETLGLLLVTGGPDISCKAAKATGEFSNPAGEAESTTATNVVVTFEKECEVTNKTGCTVTQPIKTNPLTGTILEEIGANALDVDFTANGGLPFAEVTIASCGLFNFTKAHVTGEVLCELQNVVVDTAIKLLVCLETNPGTLLFAEKEATFDLTEEVELSGTSFKGLPWDLWLQT